MLDQFIAVNQAIAARRHEAKKAARKAQRAVLMERVRLAQMMEQEAIDEESLVEACAPTPSAIESADLTSEVSRQG